MPAVSTIRRYGLTSQHSTKVPLAEGSPSHSGGHSHGVCTSVTLTFRGSHRYIVDLSADDARRAAAWIAFMLTTASGGARADPAADLRALADQIEARA